MSRVDLGKLRAFLDANAGTYAALSDQQAATLGNTPSETPDPQYRALSSRELLGWAAANGRLKSLNSVANNAMSPVNSIALAAYMMISRRDQTELDLNLADRQAMLAALVAANVWSQADADELYAMATLPNVSPFEKAGFGRVGPGHIARARM